MTLAPFPLRGTNLLPRPKKGLRVSLARRSWRTERLAEPAFFSPYQHPTLDRRCKLECATTHKSHNVQQLRFVVFAEYRPMSTQPQQREDSAPEPQFTRRANQTESFCMYCFETLRAPDELNLAQMERTHKVDCPQRPWR